ncbi:MAG TPA: glycosyl hydrolase family 28-related protein, partial [Acidimicrobiia bacterium]|nr:glycosyl hydrolase family 28-related protein [Acidimicrobiia bacterium]
ALDTAASHGGGTVYLPAGTYLVSTHLVVPSGVELRGSYSARHTAESVDGTTLLAVEGQGTSHPNSDPAFISLAAHAGIRGISIRYPNQGFGTGVYPVTAFPYTVRSLGAQTWMLDVNVLDGYQIADFATHRSDGFVVNNLWATAFSTGVNVGGGSQHGWLERIVISYGDLFQSRYGNSPHSYGRTALSNYTSKHVVAYAVGDVNGLASLGVDSFTVEHTLVAYRTSKSSPGVTNSTFFASSSDSASLAGVVLSAGTNIAFVGLLAVSPFDRHDLYTVPAFKGTATIYDADLNHDGLVRQGGTLHMFAERR